MSVSAWEANIKPLYQTQQNVWIEKIKNGPLGIRKIKIRLTEAEIKTEATHLTTKIVCTAKIVCMLGVVAARLDDELFIDSRIYQYQ